MTVPWEVIVVSSDLESRRALSSILLRQGVEPVCLSTLGETRSFIANQKAGLIFCARHLSDGTYQDLLADIRSTAPKVRMVVTSQQADWDEYLEAMKLGAFDVISEPCRPTDVEWMVIQAKRDGRSTPSGLVSFNAEEVRLCENEGRQNSARKAATSAN